MTSPYWRPFATLAALVAAGVLLTLGACNPSTDQPAPRFTRPSATVAAVDELCDLLDRSGTTQLGNGERMAEIVALRDKAGVPAELRTALATPTDASPDGLAAWKQRGLAACGRAGWDGR